nr:response regulator [Streptacidiphilus anmyonensis]
MSRSGLRLILEDQDDIMVAGEAAEGAEAVELDRRLRPDVCLVHIRLPRPDGIEVTRALAGPGVLDPLRVVIVTTFDLDEYVYDGRAQGLSASSSPSHCGYGGPGPDARRDPVGARAAALAAGVGGRPGDCPRPEPARGFLRAQERTGAPLWLPGAPGPGG